MSRQQSHDTAHTRQFAGNQVLHIADVASSQWALRSVPLKGSINCVRMHATGVAANRWGETAWARGVK
jgi:hypothetical protein